jgi:hypothetical protein
MGPSSSYVHADLVSPPMSEEELKNLIWDCVKKDSELNALSVYRIDSFAHAVVVIAKERNLILPD